MRDLAAEDARMDKAHLLVDDRAENLLALHVAVTAPPEDSLDEALREFTDLEVRYHLTTPSEFEEVVGKLPR